MRRSKKKIISWTAAAILVLIVSAGITLVLLLQHSESFRQSILARVERSLHESTGAQITIRDFHIRLSDLSMDIYGLIVRGRETDPSKPLLQTDHIRAGIRIDSFFRRTWHLTSVVINHPVAHVFINKAGETNLPQPEKKSSSSTSIFDLAIRQFALDRGEIYLNDKKNALDAELRDLQVNAAFDSIQTRYYGDLGYRQGTIRYGTYAPMVHDLQTGFEAIPATFKLNKLTLATGDSRIVVNASLDDFNNPKAKADYDATLVANDIKKILRDPTLPTGTVRLTGALDYKSDPNKPALETVTLAGDLSSAAIAVKTASIDATVRNIAAKYKLDGGNAEVQNIHAQLFGGRLDGKLTIHDLAGASQATLQAALKDVSIDDLRAAYHNQSVKQTRLSGKVSADAKATWVKSFSKLHAHSDATIQAALGQAPATPLNGAIHADYAGAAQEVTLRQSYIRTQQTSVNLDGTISKHCQLQVRLDSHNLHELELLSANFSQGSAQPQLGLYGAAAFTGNVTGSLSDPHLQGRLTADNLRVKGSSWRTLRTNVSASPSLASLTQGDAQPASGGRITFNVETALNHWAYAPSNRIAVDLSASQISVSDLEKLANAAYPVSGMLSANVTLSGSQLNPVGHGDITLTNAKVSDEPIQAFNIRFQGNGDAATANLLLRVQAGTAQANVTYHPKTESYQAQLHADNIHVERFVAVKARNLGISGAFDLDATGSGSIKSPEVSATLRMPQLKIQQQEIKGLIFQAKLQNQVADISLNTEVAATYLKANGTIQAAAPYNTNLRIDTGRIALQPLLALYSPAQAANVNGQTELHVSLQGPLQDKTRLEAHLNIPVLAASYKELQLAAAKPILVDYKNGVAVLQPAEIKGTGTDVRVQATVPIDAVNAATYYVQGAVDLRVAQILQPDLESSGQIQFDVNSQRYSAGSNLHGQIKIVNANLYTASSPVGLGNANGIINVTDTRVEISEFHAETGGGTITATGGVAYRPNIQFDLALAGNNVRLRYPEGIRAMLTSNLALTGTPQAALLHGQVRMEKVSFTPDFDLSEFITQFTGESSTGSPSAFMQSLRLDIALQNTSQMNLASSKVSLQGNANLRIVGTADAPVILGRSNLTGGELFFAGNRYVIQNGAIDFLNPVRTEPVVNLQVSTTVDQYNINLNFQGPVDHLQTTYTSDPPLPPVDIISLLAFGKTTEASAANPSTPGNMGAQAVLAQSVGQVSSRVEKLAGISHLSIDPALGGDNRNYGPRVAIQQRVTSNLLVTFATDVTSTQRQAIQIEYRLTPKWSVSGVRDQNGGFGMDAKFHKDF